jgi:signal transduction histidine kinase
MPVPTRQRDAPPSIAREVGMVGITACVTVLLVWGWSLGFHLANAHNGLIGGSWTLVGLYVVRVRPGHREGWLFVAIGVAHSLMFFGRQYGLHEPGLAGGAWLGWLGVWPLPLVIALVAWSLIAFPDGRLPGEGWRAVLGAMFVVAALMAAVSALWPVEYDRVGLVEPHPVGLAGGGTAADVWSIARGGYLLFQLAGTVAVVVRMRRADGDEARQIRWLVFAVVLDIVVLVAGLAVAGSPEPGLLLLPVIPVACGAAILKRRLYDIDPVINRTLVVAVMVSVVTAGYAAIVVGVGSLVPAPTTALSLLAVGAVAVAFEPVRRRAQRLADRVVYGHRATPYEALSRMATEVEGAPGDLLDRVAATMAGAVGASEVAVWLGPDTRLEPAGGWPQRPQADSTTTHGGLVRQGLHLRSLSHRGTPCGLVAVRTSTGARLTAAEDRVLGDLVAQATLVVVQLQQAAELRAAARRIVRAGDAARRRIERDLHDGAQHRLVTLGLELGAIAEHVRSLGDPALADRVAEARSQLLEASAELRELARGLHPGVLAEAGLPVALATLADRSPIPVRLDVDLPERPGAEIEGTAYFMVSEALTNAARHARAETVLVSVARTADGDVDVRVCDDGIGCARIERGGGLEGLADRLAALGARLDLTSRPGAGTTVRAVLPCGW